MSCSHVPTACISFSSGNQATQNVACIATVARDWCRLFNLLRHHRHCRYVTRTPGETLWQLHESRQPDRRGMLTFFFSPSLPFLPTGFFRFIAPMLNAFSLFCEIFYNKDGNMLRHTDLVHSRSHPRSTRRHSGHFCDFRGRNSANPFVRTK